MPEPLPGGGSCYDIVNDHDHRDTHHNQDKTNLPPALLNKHPPIWAACHMGGEEPSQAELQEGNLVNVMRKMIKML